jgi:hypothetical protein
VSTQEIILAVGGGLLVNEFCDVSPWAAKKIVNWSTRLRYGVSTRAEIRIEELCAVIESRPGKLLKLATALAFAFGATRAYLQRQMTLWLFKWAVRGSWRRTRPSRDLTAEQPTDQATVTIWHTQGSGKSLSVATAALKLNQDTPVVRAWKQEPLPLHIEGLEPTWEALKKKKRRTR